MALLKADITFPLSGQDGFPVVPQVPEEVYCFLVFPLLHSDSEGNPLWYFHIGCESFICRLCLYLRDEYAYLAAGDS